MLCSTSTPLQTTPLWMSYMSTPLQTPPSQSATDLCGGSCSSPLNISCTQNCQYPLLVPWGDDPMENRSPPLFLCTQDYGTNASPSFSTKSMGHNAGVDFALDGNLLDWTTTALLPTHHRIFRPSSLRLLRPIAGWDNLSTPLRQKLSVSGLPPPHTPCLSSSSTINH